MSDEMCSAGQGRVRKLAASRKVPARWPVQVAAANPRRKMGRNEPLSSVKFVDADGEVIKICLERGSINVYVDGKLRIKGLHFFRINKEEKHFEAGAGHDPPIKGYLKDGTDADQLDVRIGSMLGEGKGGSSSQPQSSTPGISGALDRRATVRGTNLDRELIIANSKNKSVGPVGEWTEDDVPEPDLPEEEIEEMMKARKACNELFGEMSKEDLMRELPIFSGCSSKFLAALGGQLRKVLLRSGQSLVTAGNVSAQRMYAIVFGSLDLTRGVQTLRTVGVGLTFGEANLMGLQTRWVCNAHASVVTMLYDISATAIRTALAECSSRAPAESSDVARFPWLEEDNREFLSRKEFEDWKVFRRSAILRRCTDSMLRELEFATESRVRFKGEVLLEEGAPCNELLIVESGEVQVEVADRCVRIEAIPGVRVKLTYPEAPLSSNRRGSIRASRRMSRSGEGEEESSQTPARKRQSRISVMVKESGPHSGHGSFALPGTPTGISDEKPRFNEEFEAASALVFGEANCVGASTSSSVTVRVLKAVLVRSLRKDIFLEVLGRHHMDKHDVAPFVTLRHEDIFPKLDVGHLGTLGLGGGSQAFWDFLQAHVEERMFHVGERVVFDSQHKNVHQKLLKDTSFCRLNRGRMRISEAGSPALRGASKDATSTVREDDLRDGAVLTGDMILSGKIFHAVEVCYVSILHRGVIARALEEYPEDRDEFLPPLAAASGEATARGNSAIRSIQERSIFAGASQEFIDGVIEDSKVRVFMPGDFIIRQGSEGFTMFILWIGSANVILESEELPADGQGARTRTLKHVGTLGHGAAFGEMAMLGVQKKRNATIVATAVCCAWEIDFKNVRAILEKHPRECDNFLNMIEGHLERVANVHLTDYHLFANFSHGFRTFLSVHAHRHLYFEGETIVKEGSAGDQLFVVNLGAARVEILGQHVQSVLRGGAHFGYGMVCRSSAKERYNATVTAESLCQVFIIRRVDFQKALTKYPDMREIARSLDTKEARLAHEQQEHAKMLVKTQVKRSQRLRCIMDACAGMFDYSTEDAKTTRQIHKLYFTAWSSETARGLAVRKEAAEVRAASQDKIERWLLRRKEQMEQTQPHRDMKTLIAQNLHTRGPLTVPKPDYSSRSVGAPSDFKSPSSSLAASSVASPYLSPMPHQRSYVAPQHVELPPLALAGLSGSPWTSRPSTGAPLSDRPNTAPVPGFVAGGPLANSPTAKPSTARGHSRRRADKWSGVALHYHQRCRRPLHWGTPSCVPDPVRKSPFDEASGEEDSLMEEVPELLEVEAVQH